MRIGVSSQPKGVDVGFSARPCSHLEHPISAASLNLCHPGNTWHSGPGPACLSPMQRQDRHPVPCSPGWGTSLHRSPLLLILPCVQSTRLPIYPPIRPFIYPFIHPPIYPTTRPSAHPAATHSRVLWGFRYKNAQGECSDFSEIANLTPFP